MHELYRIRRLPPDDPFRAKPPPAPCTRELPLLATPAARAAYPIASTELIARYSRCIGGLLYHGYACKPEILFATCKLACACSNPTELL